MENAGKQEFVRSTRQIVLSRSPQTSSAKQGPSYSQHSSPHNPKKLTMVMEELCAMDATLLTEFHRKTHKTPKHLSRYRVAIPYWDDQMIPGTLSGRIRRTKTPKSAPVVGGLQEPGARRARSLESIPETQIEQLFPIPDNRKSAYKHSADVKSRHQGHQESFSRAGAKIFRAQAIQSRDCPKVRYSFCQCGPSRCSFV